MLHGMSGNQPFTGALMQVVGELLLGITMGVRVEGRTCVTVWVYVRVCLCVCLYVSLCATANHDLALDVTTQGELPVSTCTSP